MSSITDARRPERGQVLVLMAGGMVAILLIAALVFDVGQNFLDRRTQQNASDAYALAGARYIADANYQWHDTCNNSGGAPTAVVAACQLAATQNLYAQSLVKVDVPPVSGSFAGFPSHIQVSVSTQHESFFAGLAGITTQRVSVMAVAANADNISLPFSLLSVDPDGCGVNKINGSSGSSVIINGGSVHVDSSCTPDALLLSGNGVLTAPQCDVVGAIQTSGGATNNCLAVGTGVGVAGPDPLAGLPPPAKPALAATPTRISGTKLTPPSGCPNSGAAGAATEAAPARCLFNNPYADGVWRIHPGYYPGGLQFNASRVYMDPGIYWIGGGGFQVRGGTVVSKALGDNTGTTPSGGVLIYNTQDPDPTITAACNTNWTSSVGCYDSIVMNGSGSTLALLPIQTGTYTGMVIFVDRTISKALQTPTSTAADIQLNGTDSNLYISGTVYAVRAVLSLNGDSSDTVAAQFIVYDFQINGNTTGLTINYESDGLFHISGAGLVQ